MTVDAPGTGATGARTYGALGYRLRVHGAAPLPLPLPTDAGLPEDAPTLTVTVEDVRRDVPQQPPDGTVLAALDTPDEGRFYTFTRDDDTLRLRFHGAADVEADAGLGEARLWLDPGADPLLPGVVIPGTLLAVRLMLDGRLALHAGAVDDGDGVVAFAGPSGSGKSTVSALAVLAGARLVTDDVLRVDLDHPDARKGARNRVLVWPGATGVRLRPGVELVARALADRGAHRSVTADGRLAVLPPPAVGQAATGEAAALPLRCVVLPALTPDGDVAVRVLDPFTALRRLVAAPRVVGWLAPAELDRQFHALADLCERVPVVEALVPEARCHDVAAVRLLLDLVREKTFRA